MSEINSCPECGCFLYACKCKQPIETRIPTEREIRRYVDNAQFGLIVNKPFISGFKSGWTAYKDNLGDFLSAQLTNKKDKKVTNLNPNIVLPANLKLPITIDDAIKLSSSLTLWLLFIKEKQKDKNERCPMDSYGGNVDGHLIYLTYWFKTEAIKALANSQKDMFTVDIKSNKDESENEGKN